MFGVHCIRKEFILIIPCVELITAIASYVYEPAAVEFPSPRWDNEVGFGRLFSSDKSVVDVFGV